MQADASRRPSGPRNPAKAPGSMVRLRSKSVQKTILVRFRGKPVRNAEAFREECVRAHDALSNLPDGECGVKDQVSRRFAYSKSFRGFQYHVH